MGAIADASFLPKKLWNLLGVGSVYYRGFYNLGKKIGISQAKNVVIPML